MATATLIVSPELLCQVLSLPSDTVIDTAPSRFVELTVTHPDIPDGAKTVTPEFRRQPEVVFVGWGAE